MSEQINEMLEQELRTEFEHMSTLKPGSEEKSQAINVMSKLYQLQSEQVKLEAEIEEKHNVAQTEIENSKQKSKDRYVQIGIAAAEIILPLVFYGVWMRKGFKFEESGTYTSTTFRGLFSKFKPTKR